MIRLNLKAVEERVKPLGARSGYDRSFIFELLEAYGRSRSSIARLQTGSLNVALDPSREVAQKGIVYFKATDEDPLLAIDALRTSPTVVRYGPRFVIATDFAQLLAVDTKTSETLSIAIGDIDKHFTFFLPWAGMEKAQVAAEAHADVRAAERMAMLFDELLTVNPAMRDTVLDRHGLNVFFTRLLFCLFAEDTGIFADNQFTSVVEALTQRDGSDMSEFLSDLFQALDTEGAAEKPTHLADFPYVNGRLFTAKEHHRVPLFTKKARDLLLEMGRLRWSEINPDIFGSMFQAVVTPGQRSNLGQHYTSVPNILKTIEPLFLDDLKEQFSAGYDSVRKLEALYSRIADIKVFDPACGSGNFLIIAYKELRRIEHAILERIGDLRSHHVLFADSRVRIEHFFGIEIDDFAVEVATLSLWIAKHQMNREAGDKFSVDLPLIPLKESGRIHQGNAARVDWNEICPNSGQEEIYLISNPPYKGGKSQGKEMKEDYAFVFKGRFFSKDLDYIALWFVKGSDYIAGTQAQLAFVTTNSVSQGEHVGLMFPMIFDMDIEIGFAYTSFRWGNNSRGNPGVSVAIISLRCRQPGPKYLYTDLRRTEVTHINGYLADAPSISIYRRSSAITTALPRMVLGSMPKDGGHLLLQPAERAAIISKDPNSAAFIRPYVGSAEYINGTERYCLWITDKESVAARAIDPVRERLESVSRWRRQSTAPSTAAYADRPHQFIQNAHKDTECIIVPRHSSEKRDYIPIGYLPAGTVIADSANAIYDAKPWVFAILTARMHMAWTRAVAGQLETRIRYGAFIVYNNFPIPGVDERSESRLTESALRILDVREYHSELTLAQLYDPDSMPDDLRLAHQRNDDLVDSMYQSEGFETDEERLSHLFTRYEDMIRIEHRA